MKKWENPELMILGVENTKEEGLVPVAPPWQDCDCYLSGDNHTHQDKYPGHPGCPCCGQIEPSLS